MAPTNESAEAFLARRAAWVAAGRPADHDYARECAATVARLEEQGLTGPAFGFRSGDRFITINLRDAS